MSISSTGCRYINIYNNVNGTDLRSERSALRVTTPADVANSLLAAYYSLLLFKLVCLAYELCASPLCVSDQNATVVST
jgi:hypothetical protein